MAVTLTGAGGLFTRLGKIGKAVNAQNEWRGMSGSLVGKALAADFITPVLAQVDGDNANIRGTTKDLLNALATQLSSTGQGALLSALQTAAQNLIIQQVNADTPLSALSVKAAMTELIAQMTTGGYYVSPNTISAAVTPGGSNVGNGVLLTSTKDGAANAVQYLFNETINLSATSIATAGAEQFTAVGAMAQSDYLSYLWPGGSGCATSIVACDPAVSGSVLTNGAFETFTVANTPDNWTITVGTAGTHIFKELTTIHKGAAGIKIVGGATLTAIEQTIAGLTPLTQYAVNLFAKVDVVPAAGVLTVELIDGSGTVINDNAGTANSFTVTLSGLTTSFAAKNAFFRLPATVPSTVKLRIRISTALSGGSNLFIDTCAMKLATSLYAGGPQAVLFAGATNYGGADTFSIAGSNNYAGKWQGMLNRLLNMPNLGLYMPTTGSTLVNDSLLT